MKINDILLFESFPLAKKEFSQEADPAEVEKYISKYREFLSRSYISDSMEKDINYWRKTGFKEFKLFVDITASIIEKNKKIKEIAKDYIIISDSPEYKVVVPCSHPSSKKFGQNSTWCTSSSNPTYFRNYFYNRKTILIIIINKKSYEHNYCIRYDSESKDILEVQDLTQNSEDSYSEFVKAYGDPKKFVMDTEEHANKIISLRDKNSSIENADYDIDDKNIDIEKLLKYIVTEISIGNSVDPNDIYRITYYGEINKNSRYRNIIERAILKYKNSNAAINYVSLDGNRWPEAEKFISKEREQAVYYAKKYIGKRWPEAEPVILKSFDAISRIYMLEVADTRIQEMESKIISLDNRHTEAYLRKFFVNGWIEYERFLIDKIVKLGDFHKEYTRILKYISLIDDEYKENTIVRLFKNGLGKAFLEYLSNWKPKLDPIEDSGIIEQEFVRLYEIYPRQVTKKDYEKIFDILMSIDDGKYVDFIVTFYRDRVYTKEIVDKIYMDHRHFSKNIVYFETKMYVNDTLKIYDKNDRRVKRDVDLEKSIIESRCPKASTIYAIYILKQRWQRVEEFIKKDPKCIYEYAKRFFSYKRIKGKQPGWKDAENELLESGSTELLVDYAIDVLNKRWFKAEEKIAWSYYEDVLYSDYFNLEYDYRISKYQYRKENKK